MRTLPLFLVTAVLLPAADLNSDYSTEVERWREKRESAITADGGWLTVTGIFWLKDGENTIGSDAANDILLPETAPAHFGTLILQAGRLTFRGRHGSAERPIWS